MKRCSSTSRRRAAAEALAGAASRLFTSDRAGGVAGADGSWTIAPVLNGLDKFLLFVALPTVVVASLLEAIVLARRRSYDWRATSVSLFDLFARVAMQILLPFSIAAPLIALAYRHRIGGVA